MIVKVGESVQLSNILPFVLIAGPCQMESRDHAMMMAERLVKVTARLGVPLIFKTSFDKANRTSFAGKRGVGLEKSLPVFQEIRNTFGCPVLTDVHKESDIDAVKDVVDVIQIPAFLCRQTDLLEAAAASGKVINVKKGQFLAPQDAKNIVAKFEHFGNRQISLTERGVTFGYNNLVVDMRAFPIMKETGYPVIIDATHSTQQPGGQGTVSGGDRDYAPVLANAALTCGIAGVFAEVHNDPDNAPSDGACMLKLDEVERIFARMKAIDELVKSKGF